MALKNSDSTSILGCPIDAPYAAGCGGPYALGALKVLDVEGADAREILKKAIEVAASISPGCDANCDILTNGDL